MTRLVAIHQPNFLPWLGFFDKIARADVFVLLDDAQFQKTGGTWTNRVQVAVNEQPWWLTVPITRNFHGVKPISEIVVNDATPWRSKAVETLRLSYRRAPHFDEVFPLVERALLNPTTSLAHMNIDAIDVITDRLGLDRSKLVRSSSLDVTTTSTARLVAIVTAVGGDAYLEGGGAAGYQDNDQFSDAGIELVRQDFEHPTYEQTTTASEFLAGLSIIDSLFNCGCDETAAFLGRAVAT